ncbi:DUF349 domain-containing protein [Aquipuribacter sp. MA13-6]|uniref:DUF349 domain-containing protein n=1 Tax=unclassified Aquipuribacter TaxID=2635084 RepID=UPI003EEA632F
MSTEPSPSGPDQQEPVDVAPEAAPAPPADRADGSQDPAQPDSAGDEQNGEQNGDEQADEQTSASSVLGAVAGAIGGLAKDVVTGAADALLSRREHDTSDETASDETASDETEDAPEASTPEADAPQATASGTSAPDSAAPSADAPDVTPDAPTAAPDAAASEPEAAPEPEAAEPEAAPEPDVAGEPVTVTEPEADAPQPDAPQPDAPQDGAPDEPAADEPAAEGQSAAEPAPAPKPTPSPVPSAPAHDAPRPSDVMPARAHTPAPAAAVTPPLAVGAASFGRVDEAGVVHVRDGDEEREVGQYPDVPHSEALAFYVRKFEDLAAQVHLLGQRLDNGTVPAKEARASLVTLRTSATEAKAVGDLPTLRAELDRLDGLVAERTKVEDAQRAAARAQALAEREAIVVEAEQIAATPAQSMHFKNAGERMQALLDTWKTAQRSGTRLDKRSEDPLWKRFAAARSTVDRMRRAHFAQVSDQRSETKSAKEQLIARAEELQTSTDWRSASDEYRSLMDSWKSAGRLSRKDDDALWARFRAAQDVFFAARTAANSAQDEEYKANLEVKEKLLLEAEALLPVTDLDRARKALGSIQDRWDDAGRVPRGDLDRIEGRLKAVIEKVRDADSAKWGKGKPEVVARGSGLVLQLRQQVADLDAKVTEAEARGDTRTASRAAKERATKQAWLDQAEASLDDISR